VLNNLKNRFHLAARILFTGQTQSGLRDEIPSITPEEVADAKEFFLLNKYFIFGHARSGTTLLVRLIRVHPVVHCNYQAHFFTRPPLLQSLVMDTDVEVWLSRRSNRWNQGKDLSTLVLRVSADFIMERDARRVGKQIVGDKSPSSLLHGKAVQLMHKVYPDSRLIYIVRDGRDAVVSHRFQSFIDASQHLSKDDLAIREAFQHEPEPFLQGERSIFTPRGLQRSVEGWVQNATETEQLGRELYNEHYISLRYEDLLERPYREMIRLWKFLDADVNVSGLDDLIASELQQNPDADWQRQKAGDLVEPLKKGKQGSWQDLFTVDDRLVFKRIGGRTLVDWGYEKNLDW